MLALLFLLVLAGACPVILRSQVAPISPAWVVEASASSKAFLIDSGTKLVVCEDGKTLRMVDVVSGEPLDTVTLDTTYQQLQLTGDQTTLFAINIDGDAFQIDRYAVDTWQRLSQRQQFAFQKSQPPRPELKHVFALMSDSMLLVVTDNFQGGKYFEYDDVLHWINLHTLNDTRVAGYGSIQSENAHRFVPFQQRIGLPARHVKLLVGGDQVGYEGHIAIGDQPGQITVYSGTDARKGEHGFHFDSAFSRVLSDNRVLGIANSTEGVVPIPYEGQISTSPLPSWHRFIRWFAAVPFFDVYDAAQQRVVAEAFVDSDSLVRVLHNPWNTNVVLQTTTGKVYCYNLATYDSFVPTPECNITTVPDSTDLYEVVSPRFVGYPPVESIIRWYVNDAFVATGKTPSIRMQERGSVEVSCRLFADSNTTASICSVIDTIQVVAPVELRYHAFTQLPVRAVLATEIQNEIVVVTDSGTTAYIADVNLGSRLRPTWTHPAVVLGSTAEEGLYQGIVPEVLSTDSKNRFLRLHYLSQSGATGRIDSIKMPDELDEAFLKVHHGQGVYHATTGATIWSINFLRSPNGTFTDDVQPHILLVVTKPDVAGVPEVMFDTLAWQEDTWLQDTIFFFGHSSFTALNLNNYTTRKCEGIKTTSVPRCFPASNLFSNAGILYEERGSTWVLVDTITFGAGQRVHTPANNPDISIIVMGDSKPKSIYGIFHKPTRKRTYRSDGWFGDAEASAITRNADYVLIGTRQGKLGVYEVALNTATSVDADVKPRVTAQEAPSNFVISAATPVAIPLHTRHIVVSDLQGRCVGEIMIVDEHTFAHDNMQLLPGWYLLTYVTDHGATNQGVILLD